MNPYFNYVIEKSIELIESGCSTEQAIIKITGYNPNNFFNSDEVKDEFLKLVTHANKIKNESR